MALQPPDGYQPNRRKSPLTDPWEPLYARETDDKVELGLIVAEPHTNSRGLLHGGLIAALSDKVMGTACGRAVRRDGTHAAGLVTVSLGVDYMGQAKIGDWLAFEGDYVRTGRTLCFAGAQVTANGAAIARAHATFRVLGREALPRSPQQTSGANHYDRL